MESSTIFTNNLSATTPSLKKSLRELSQANSTLGLNTESSLPKNDHHPFLTQSGIDTTQLQRKVHELEFHQNATSSSAIGNASKKQRCMVESLPSPHTTSLTKYLNYTREAQVESILQKEIDKVKQKTEARVQSRLLEDWKEMKNKIIKNVVGGRHLGGISLIHGDDDTSAFDFPRCQTYVDELGELPFFAKKHLELLLNYSKDGNKNGGGILLGDLTKLLEGHQRNSSTTLGYYNATRLLDSMLSSSSKNTTEDQAIGALDFLSRQFKSFLISSVKNAGRSMVERGPGLVGYINAFVEIEVGREKVGWGGMDVVWRYLYYSLRCGDAIAALEAVKSCKEIPHAILQILDFMTQSQKQSSSGNIFESALHDKLTSIPLSLRQNVIDLHYRATSGNQSSDTVNAHKLACLAMLSLSDPSSGSYVATTMEDYVFMSLWNAVYSLENNENSSLSCENQIATLGKNIQHWGPTHFDDEDGSNVWAYAMPLLLSQQFRPGLIHVASVGGAEGLCMAVHLALGMFSVGFTVEDWKNAHDVKNVEASFLTRLLVTYSSSLQVVSPEAALTYLVQIPDVEREVRFKTSVQLKNGQQLGNTALNEICRLLLDTKSFQALAGDLSPDGTRTVGAAMDDHLTADGVSNVLAKAADKAIHRGDVSNAAELLCLAGHYSSLIALLNRQLASLLVVSEGGKEQQERRRFWRDAAIRFYNTYLVKGQTQVLQVLEKENKFDLGNAFQLLMNLMIFFDHCHEKKWESAWDLIRELDLFPTTELEIPQKVESFHSLHTEVQQQFHHVITNAMESLYQQHEALKVNLGGDRISPSASAIQQRLKEVRLRGRILVTFAGLIPFLNFSDEEKARISRMEAYMI